jgi:hypothetical protein
VKAAERKTDVINISFEQKCEQEEICASGASQKNKA